MKLRVCGGLAVVALIVSGRSSPDSGTPAAGIPGSGTAATPTSSAAPTTSPGSSTTPGTPVGGGSSTCLEDSVVQDAIGGLTPFMASAWQLDEQGDPCATLAWATARIADATSSSPETVLFFHDNTYLGTATAEQYAFTTVVDQLPDTVAVSYKWINPGDANANPTGGPALVRYRWNGSSVDMLDQLPPEVLNPPRANPAPGPAPGLAPVPAPGPAPVPAPAGNVDPATGSVCVENSARDAALASLPPFEGRGWVDSTSSYPCLPLVTFLTRPESRNMYDDPSYLLFFHDGQYLGKANDVPYPNMSVADSGYDFVTIAYRWRVPGDDAISPGGGPALVRYQWNGSSVETIGAIPVEVTG